MAKEQWWGRHRRTPCRAIFLIGCLTVALPVQAEQAVGDLALGLSVDVLGSASAGFDSADQFHFDLIGMPLSIGARNAGSATPGLALGIDGAYALPLYGALSVVTSGSLEKTRYLQDVFWGSDRAVASAKIQHEHDGWQTALEPGFVFDQREGEMVDRRYLVDSWAMKEILHGLTFRATAGYTRQDAPPGAANNASFSRVQGGLVYQLGDGAKLDLAYDMIRKRADLSHESNSRTGPSAGLTFEMFDFLSISSRYQYCENIEYQLNGTNLREVVDEIHSVGMNASWRDPDAEYLTITADYRFEQVDDEAVGRSTRTHDGMISLGLRF